MTDLHAVLHVSRSASLKDIKKAYRNLALKFHPDLNPPHRRKEVEQQFIKITEAYNTLTELKMREESRPRHSNVQYNHSYHQPPTSSPHSRQDPFKSARRPHYQGSNFDTKTWKAWHYGENTIWVDAVQHRSRNIDANEGPTKHQAFFIKKRQSLVSAGGINQKVRDNLHQRRSDRVNNTRQRRADDCVIM